MLVDMRKQIIITRTSKVEGWVGVCRGVSQLFNVDLMVV